MDAEATALDLGEGSEERVKGTMGDERCLQGLTNDSQDWPPKEESQGRGRSILLGPDGCCHWEEAFLPATQSQGLPDAAGLEGYSGQ